LPVSHDDKKKNDYWDIEFGIFSYFKVKTKNDSKIVSI